MELSRLVQVYIVSLSIFLVVDFLWLGFLAKGVYAKYLGKLMADKVNWLAAICFYLIYVGGIVYFAVLPGLAIKELSLVMQNGALFGFLAYATYDLTNYATLRDWPGRIVLIDLIWGAFLTTLVSTSVFLIFSSF